MTKIKICGLKRTEDISYVNELLPDFAGFVFAKSSRQVDAKKTAELKKQQNRAYIAGVCPILVCNYS